MPHIKISATKFVLDKGRFSSTLVEIISGMLEVAAEEALKRFAYKIPVWTGESRGGLRAMAEALGVNLNIVPEQDPPARIRRFGPRKNRFGEFKSPDSAESHWIPPHRLKVYSVNMSFVNNGDGFEFNDMQSGGATNLRHPTPWGFTESFRRGVRTRLARMMRNHKLGVQTFVLKKTIYVA